MLKLMITMKKKKGTTREEFMSYYEDKHLPFLISIMPKTGTTRTHIRNFVNLEDPFLASIGDGRAVTADPDFDAITEVIFEDREGAASYFAMIFEPEMIAKIKEDEGKFVDLESVRFYAVDAIERVRSN
jgi:hypothetical protein